MNKIITNREMHYIRVERNDITFQQDKIYPDVIDAIEELKEENKQLKEIIKEIETLDTSDGISIVAVAYKLNEMNKSD